MVLNFNDQTGNAKHAKPTNMPTAITTIAGPLGEDVAVFDGVDDYAPAAIDYTGVTKLSIALWFRADSALLTTGQNILFANANAGATTGFSMSFIPGATPRFYWYHGANSSSIITTPDEWHLAVCTVDTVALLKQRSIDGAAYIPSTPAAHAIETGYDTRIGARRSLSSQFFGGAVAYAAVFPGTILTEAQKNALYAAATPAAYKALAESYGAAALWSLQDEPASTADHFVNPVSGDDANDGSQRFPWASIDHAKDQTTGGQVVELADGTYTEDSGAGYLDMGGLAYPSQVVFRAQNAGLPVIESASSVFTIFAGTATQNWTFEHVKFKHRDTGMRWIVYFAGGCDDITLDRCTWEVNGTVHASGGDCVYVSANTATNLRILDPVADISNGQDFGFLHVATGGAVANGLTLTGMALAGDSVRARFIHLADLRGACTIDGSVAAAGSASDTSHLIHIEDAGAACTLDFGTGLTLAAANCRGISIMEAGSAANMTVAGGDVTVTSARRGFGAEFGVTGAMGSLTVTKSGAAVNNAVELRSDSADSGTLAVKNFTVDSIVIDQAAAAHGLLMGRHSEGIEVKSLTINDGAQDIALVDKGDGNSVGTVTPATIHGGSIGAMYLKGARNAVHDNTRIYQANGGEAISFVFDDVAGNKTQGNSVLGVWVTVTNGTLFEHDGAAVDGGGNLVDYNIYDVRAGQSWGQVYGTPVASYADVLAAWDSYDTPTNDENSVFTPRYEVRFRSTADGTDTLVAQVTTDLLTYTIEGLAADSTGYYWINPVTMCNVGNDQAVNRRVRRVAMDDSADLIAPAPNAPFGLQLTPGPGGKMTATWRYRGAGAEAEADRFLIYRAIDPSSIDYSAADDAVLTVRSSNSFELGTFAHGQVVKCSVRAATSANVEETNTVVASAVADTVAPSAPATLVAEVVDA